MEQGVYTVYRQTRSQAYNMQTPPKHSNCQTISREASMRFNAAQAFSPVNLKLNVLIVKM